MFSFLNNNQILNNVRNTNKGFGLVREILGAIVVFMLAQIIQVIPNILFAIIQAFVLGLTQGSMDNFDELYLTIVSLWIQIVGIMFIFIWSKRKHDFSIKNICFKKDKCLSHYAKGALVAFLVMAIVLGVGVVTNSFTFVKFGELKNWWLIVLALGGFLIQGAYEEVFCRGYMLSMIARKHSTKTAIIVSSLFFSIIHLFNENFNILPCINIFIFGVFAAIYMLKSDNLWGICAFHSIWNFVQGCVFGFSVSGSVNLPSIFEFSCETPNVLSGGGFGPEGGLIVTVIMIVATVLLLYLPKKQSIKTVSES